MVECGCDVWFYEFEPVIGDSLLEKLGEGLATSRLGVIVLGERSFEKKWSRAEFNWTKFVSRSP